MIQSTLTENIEIMEKFKTQLALLIYIIINNKIF